MKRNLKKFEEYLKDALNHHVDNDNDDVIVAIQDIIMEFQQIFRPEASSEDNS